ncbi:MAG: peptidase M14 [Planctomycetes bacterium]|nr:peptidase M14 [Planctomycetota bacterium]
MIALTLLTLIQQGAPKLEGFPGLAAGRAPKVEIAWNRLYDTAELYAHFDRLVAQWPELFSMQVIGHSVESRDMRVYTLHNPKSGAEADKPAMWVDGNVHGNEVQGGEAVLYLAWYLLENYGSNPRATELVDGSLFYLLPSQNPDGRAHWFEQAHNAHSSRTGVQPVDDDKDGLFDEDPPDDLDGDGQIVMMRKYVPGQGDFRLNADDPRVMERVPANDKGIKGDWIYVGQEGLDNDGDGQVNEDEVGGYDMNRAWPSMWFTEFVQGGAGPYPLYWPETRSIARFILAHPNLAAVQSFHNNGGMILRGPGAEAYGEYPRADVAVYDELGKDGEKMLPFYKYMIIWRDLYSVFGGFVTWTYEGLGILSFTNELWNDDSQDPEKRIEPKERYFFDDKLLLGAGLVPWHPYTHPLYGEVEIGGFKKDVGRVPPSFLEEEMLHRNALFCIRHAEALPRIAIQEPVVTDLGGGVRAIDVIVANERAIPTRSAVAREKKIGTPDVLALEGKDLEVLAGGFRGDRFRPEEIELQEHEPARLLREAGLGSRAELRVRWIVRGTGSATIRYTAEKARDATRAFELR